MADGIYGALIEAEDGRWHAAYVRGPEEVEDHMLFDAWDPEYSEPDEAWTVLGPFWSAEEAEAYVPSAAVRSVHTWGWLESENELWARLPQRSVTPDGPPPERVAPPAPGRVEEAWAIKPTAARETVRVEGIEPWEDDVIMLFESREAAEHDAQDRARDGTYVSAPGGSADLYRVDLRGIDHEHRPDLTSSGTDVIVRESISADRLGLVTTY